MTDSTSKPLTFTRRAVLGAGAAWTLSGCPRPTRPVPPSIAGVVADAHAHVFNGADIPARAFMHHIVSARASQFVADALGPLWDTLDAIAATAVSAESEGSRLLTLLERAQPAEREAVPAAKRSAGEEEQEARRLIEETLRRQLSAPPAELAAREDTGPQLRDAQARAAAGGRPVSELNAEELLGLVLEQVDPSTLREHAQEGPGLTAAAEPDELVRERVKRAILDIVSGGLHFLKLATASRLGQAQELAATYPEVQLFLPALVDFDRWTGYRGSARGRTRARSSPQEQVPVIERLSKLAILGKLGRAPVHFHGMVSFDPRREAEDLPETYASDTAAFTDAPLPAPGGDWARRTVDTAKLPGSFLPMRHAVEHGGFVGVKLYPPVGFKPLGNGALEHLQPDGLGERIDRALHRFYAYCEREEVPLLVHMGISNAFDRDFRYYAHPGNWEPVLARYPKLRVNFGHFGHTDGVTGEGGDYDQTWASIASELMQRHESVYADLGNVDLAAESEVVKLLQHLLGRWPKLAGRLLYGSDWYMNSLQGIRTLFYKDMLGVIGRDFAAAGPDFVENFAGRNTLRFLGLLNEDGTRRDGKQRGRLKRFYAGQSEPDWLK